ncbi:MAG: mechanosensitive ion channel domain-containing protein [Aquisalimonadaceae bacterium]
MTISHLPRALYPFIRLLAFMALLVSGAVIAQSGEGVGTSSDSASYDVLADILEDDQARSRLIEDLRQLAAQDDSSAAARDDAGKPGEGEAPGSFAGQLAGGTQAFAQGVVAEFNAGMAALSALGEAESSPDYSDVAAAALNLALVIVATVALFLVLRRLVRPLFARTGAWALQNTAGSPLLRRAVAVIGALVLDLLVIVTAWVGGYLLALFVVGGMGALTTLESLFLNAFLLVEVFKSVIRMVFASKDDGLRLLPMPAEEAAYWNAWLARLSGIVGYGMLLVVPMINVQLAPALGRVAALLIMIIAFLYTLVIVLQNRVRVAKQLKARALNARFAVTRVMLGMLARSWHLVIIAYFALLGVATLLRPEDALPLILQATVQTLMAIAGGVFLSVVLSQIISRQLHVPEETRQRFPMLEERLNGFIPMALKIMRLVILVVVIALVLDAWGLFNLASWLGSEVGMHTVVTAVTVALIVTTATALWIGLASWIEHRLNPDAGHGEPTAREKTLLTIFRNAVAVTLIIMTLMIVLSEIGINIGPLIAGAGVLGLAIGFGAQKLVQDIITGVFIQMENAINTGDVITAAGITGTAERLTIRSLGIRDLAGTYHLIPFSSVDNVSNYMRDFAYHVGEYGVAYRENTDDVIVRLREAFDELVSDPEQRSKVLGELEVHGVTALADSSVNIRVRIKTLPGAQWAVGREYNRLVKRHLDAAGIEIPFPHLTLYFGQDKDGSAPPAPVVLQERQTAEKLPSPEGEEQPDDARANPKHGGDFDDAER